MYKYLVSYLVCGIVVLTSCQDDDMDNPIVLGGQLAGGETSIFSTGPDAFTFPLDNLDGSGVEKHFIADAAFGQQFVTAPAVQFGGIGPLFNQNSCEGCHVRNGRGIVPSFDADPASGLLLRLSVPGTSIHGGPLAALDFGAQLQSKAIFGVLPEGQLSVTHVDKIINFVNGDKTTLRQPIFSITDSYKPLPPDLLISPRNAPPVHGLGLLEAIDESDIVALADEFDRDNDGISGRANNVWDVLQQKHTLGRFGWKAGQPTAAQQAADAAHNDMGLTSFYFPKEHCDGQDNCAEGLGQGLDIDEETVDLLAFYFQTLAVPAARDLSTPAVIAGKQLFDQAACSSCHHPSFTTGDHDIDALSQQLIYPYTDLLLHDMGDGLADHRPEFLANGREWRTPPLWGVGLTQVINSKATFLHDGRAANLEEAILWHGGEAKESRDFYLSLTPDERAELLAFLRSI